MQLAVLELLGLVFAALPWVLSVAIPLCAMVALLIGGLLASPEKTAALSAAIRAMAPGDAAGRVCDAIAGS